MFTARLGSIVITINQDGLPLLPKFPSHIVIASLTLDTGDDYVWLEKNRNGAVTQWALACTYLDLIYFKSEEKRIEYMRDLQKQGILP